LKEPAFMELLGSIPTTWDETKIVQGKIGEFIISARRHGDDWFIGGLNNTVARDISLSFDFIPRGTYEATICKDGVNANSYAADYAISVMKVQADQRVNISMAMGGGFMIKLSKQ
jgi:alpha-glucosidase